MKGLRIVSLKDDKVLNAQLAAVDAMAEVDRPGKKHASASVLNAGQAAVDAVNARKGRP